MKLERGDKIVLRGTIEGFDGDSVLINFGPEPDRSKVRLQYDDGEIFLPRRIFEQEGVEKA